MADIKNLTKRVWETKLFASEWIQEHLIHYPLGIEVFDGLYQSYEADCTRNNVPTIIRSKFSKIVVEHFKGFQPGIVRVRVHNKRAFQNILFKTRKPVFKKKRMTSEILREPTKEKTTSKSPSHLQKEKVA